MGHWRFLFPPNEANKDYLFSHDLLEKEHHLIIEKVTQGQVTGEKGMKSVKGVLTFQGAKKKLALNVTNCQTIAQLYGNEVKGWVGKAITIYPTTTEYNKKIVGCIRVRSVAPKSTKGGEALNDVPPPNPDHVMSEAEKSETLAGEKSE
jgi:hypothetical protein